MVDISVVITFYNQDYNKLFQSLYSVIRQKDISFEIVITDDGSRDFNKDLIETWFVKYNFQNYVIVCNKVNQGTVINTLIGWRNASSKYVKMLSPGDFLYDSYVLRDLVKYMDSIDADICFGRIAPYKINEHGHVEIVSLNQPKDLKPYVNYDKKQIQRNYLIKKDYPCGMSFAGKRELMIEYIEKIAGKARFYEDCTYILIVAAGQNIRLWNHNVIWYEVGEGISTSSSRKGGRRALESNKITYEIVKKEYPEWKEAFEPFKHSTIKKVRKRVAKLFWNIKNKDMASSDSTYGKKETHEYDMNVLYEILSMK